MAQLTRAELAAMSWEELEAAGLDDCGQPLEDHPPLPPAKPMGWTSNRDRTGMVEKHRQGGRRAASIQPTLFGRRVDRRPQRRPTDA